MLVPAEFAVTSITFPFSSNAKTFELVALVSVPLVAFNNWKLFAATVPVAVKFVPVAFPNNKSVITPLTVLNIEVNKFVVVT